MDATGYGFLLLVISIIVFIKFYLLGGGGAGGGEVKQNKKLADLSEFDYKKHDDAEVVEKKQPSALRLRPIHKHGEEESTPTAAAAAPAKAKPAQQAPVAEEKKQEKIVVAEEKKEEVPPPPAKQEEPVEEKPKVEEPVAVAKEEVQEESAEEKADAEKDEADEGDANAEDEDEDDDDDDEDEDDEEEEKDLHEVVNSASVPSSSTIAASVSLQGKRPKNEDRAVIQAPVESHPEVSVFGIFDGHDGNKASEYCSKYMVKNITSQKIFPKLMDKAITQGFLKTDKKFLDKMEAGGTTAIVAVLQQKNNKTTLFVANAGDSRCVASVAGSAVALSVDHKPDLPAEQERVNATTHEVQQSVEIVQGKRLKISRIDGTLAVSRAIGDGDFKDDPNAAPALQAVSPVPEIQTVEITPEHEFAVLACDGLWDVLSNQEVVDFVKSKLSTVASPDDLATITKALVSHAVYEKQSTDNVTALIIKF